MASWGWSNSDKPDEASQKILIALAFSIILWLLTFLYKPNKLTPPLPPGPRGLPFVGYLPFLGSELHQSFTHLASRYGPIFKVRLGNKNCIVISSPSLVKEVVRDQDVTFANRDPTIAATTVMYGASDIAFSNYGDEWRKMRKIFATEVLSNSNLDSTYGLRRRQVKKMIADAYEKAGEVVDIGELAFLTVMNATMAMVLGQTLKQNQGSAAVRSEFRAVLEECMVVLGAPNVSEFFPWLARFDLQGIKRRAEMVFHQCDKILDSAVNIHNTEENNNVEQKHFLGFLAQLTKHKDPPGTSSLSLVQVKALLMDIVIGGMDTTVTTVEWAMALLLKHPKVMKAVQHEMTEIVGLSTCVEESHLPKLKYLKAAVKETLRLHPAIPLLFPHCPSKSTTVGGYTIPKGARIFLNVFAIQRDPQLWEDPLEFKPERFLRDSYGRDFDYSGNHLQYLPLGSGRRICPGIALAERMSMHVLASLLHAFEWSLPDGVEEVDLSERFGIIVKKAKPLFGVPRPRLSSSELYSYSE